MTYRVDLRICVAGFSNLDKSTRFSEMGKHVILYYGLLNTHFPSNVDPRMFGLLSSGKTSLTGRPFVFEWLGSLPCRSWCFVELLKLRRMAWWFGWMPTPWWSIRRSPWTFFSRRTGNFSWEICLDLWDCVCCLEGRWNTWNTGCFEEGFDMVWQNDVALMLIIRRLYRVCETVQ